MGTTTLETLIEKMSINIGDYIEVAGKQYLVVRGKDLGRDNSNRFIPYPCQKCGKQRWTEITLSNKIKYPVCQRCVVTSRRGDKNQNWKGGKRIIKGYIQVKLNPDDFFYPMATKQGYVLEHRLIMAKHLNRCLLPWEVVHHKNGDKADNQLENLELLPKQAEHICIQNMAKRIKQLEGRVTLLEAENVALKREVV